MLDINMSAFPLEQANKLEMLNFNEPPNVLHPDDVLMKKFQDALKKHLLQVCNELSQEIQNIEISLEGINKEYEAETLHMYLSQQSIAQQQWLMDKYEKNLINILNQHENVQLEIEQITKDHSEASNKFSAIKESAQLLSYDLDKLSFINQQFLSKKKDLIDSLIVKKRSTEKNKNLRYELSSEKHYKDYIILKLEDEVKKLKESICSLEKQITVKAEEKCLIKNSLSDVDTDLEVLYKDQKNFYNTWNSVVLNIAKQDKLQEEMDMERKKLRELLYSLQREGDTIKKNKEKHVEENENLTVFYQKLENDVNVTLQMTSKICDKIQNQEHTLMKIINLLSITQKEHDTITANYEDFIKRNEELYRELDKISSKKAEVEQEILRNFDLRCFHDKTSRHLNDILLNNTKLAKVQELSVLEASRNYGERLLEHEVLVSISFNIKSELSKVSQQSLATEKNYQHIIKDIDRHDALIEKKRNHIQSLNTAINKILLLLSGTKTEDLNHQEICIVAYKKDIDEYEEKNKSTQQFWLRQQRFHLFQSQERYAQLQTLHTIGKQIGTMKQKSAKLDYILHNLSKDDLTLDKTMRTLQFKLTQAAAQAVTYDLTTNDLEAETCFVEDFYEKSMKAELTGVLKLREECEELVENNKMLKEQLAHVQYESLSWEKKLLLAEEMAKSFKVDKNTDGSIGLMKSEIHRMETRLSHLKKAQENLILDMEFCVSRRDLIVKSAVGTLNVKKKTPDYTFVHKRMNEETLEFQNLLKRIKQTDSKIAEINQLQNVKLEKLNILNNSMSIIENLLIDLETTIVLQEFKKNDFYKKLLCKQRMGKLLQDIVNGRYKTITKNEIVLIEEKNNQQTKQFQIAHILEQLGLNFPVLKNHIQTISSTLQIN